MTKQPRAVFTNVELPHPLIFLFPPNRETLGGTAYFIVENTGNLLVDCPAWNDTNQDFLAANGGVNTLVITHRGAIAQVKAIQSMFQCNVMIQEQEAYLLPGLQVTSFPIEAQLSPTTQVIWTPGHSPGSACVYHKEGILWTGRHLLPTPQGVLMPIKTAKTFHWLRQLNSVQHLRTRFNPETLKFICPGANLGFLRGQLFVDQAYQRLTATNIEAA
jgi:glyoxylase-like metal-dependent hydrolase (beta-lactamase superfamily II)